jgi:transposase-like protein
MTKVVPNVKAETLMPILKENVKMDCALSVGQFS